MEFLQAQITSNRQADFYDVLANSFGTFSGFLTILFYTRIRKLN
jgi:hypothetical protein